MCLLWFWGGEGGGCEGELVREVGKGWGGKEGEGTIAERLQDRAICATGGYGVKQMRRPLPVMITMSIANGWWARHRKRSISGLVR